MTAEPAAPRAILFDLDGTLVDSGRDIAAAANHVRRQEGLEPLPAPVAIGYVGDGVQLLLQRILSHGADRPVTDADVQRGLATFAAYYEQHLLDDSSLYPGIADLLDRLADRTLLVATNKPRRFTLAILDGLGVVERFAGVTAGDDVDRRKPDPAHLTACLAGTGIGPEAAIMVGDSPNDVLAARPLGMRSVAVSWGLVARERLVAAEPSVIADDVPALARQLGVS